MAKRPASTAKKSTAEKPDDVKSAKPAASTPNTSKNSNATQAKAKRKAAAPKAAPVLASSTTAKPQSAQPAAQAAYNQGPEALPMAFVDRGLPLPSGYGLDRLVALVRDPHWIHGYWELNGSRLPQVVAERGRAFVDSCAWVLRIHRIYEGTAVDVEIDPASGNWYMQVAPGGRFQLELGLLSPDGEWISLAVSQVIETPLDGPSSVIDDEWRMRPEDEEAFKGATEALADAQKRGTSMPLGASRLMSSFALASSRLMPGSSESGRPVASSWASFPGSSRVSGSGGAGGFGWMVGAGGALEPNLERPTSLNGGPNWNIQSNLPPTRGKTQQPHFKVKLPRLLQGVPLPSPSWPPADLARVTGKRTGKLKNS